MGGVIEVETKKKEKKSRKGKMNEEGLGKERKKVKSQFQELEDANEYCETHYYGNTEMRVPELVKPNEFWSDFAKHVVETKDVHNFISPNFIYACNSTTEIIAMMAILDLSFNEPNHTINIEGDKGIKITSSSNLIIFKKEIKEIESLIGSNLLSIHRFYEYENPDPSKTLSQYLTHQVYTCEVVITNVSTTPQSFQILSQIPSGAVPLTSTNYQKT
jgi:hypothetical protein